MSKPVVRRALRRAGHEDIGMERNDMELCYTCEAAEARWMSGQVATCDGCAAKYENKYGIEAVLLPTAEQIEAEAGYLLAGVGTN